MQELIVYYNKEYVLKSQVHISPDDRGFLFADGIYDVIRYYNGKLFCWPQHAARIKYGLQELQIPLSEVDALEEICLTLFKKNNYNTLNDYVAYIHITRGVYKRMHGFPPENIEPTIYITAYPVSPNYKGMQQGVNVITLPDIRWGRCDIKSIALIANQMAKQKAIEQNCYEALFIKNNTISEGSHTSVFGIKNNQLITHPSNTNVLPSITRSIITSLCNKLKISVLEKNIPLDELQYLDELFLVGTTTEVMPVIKVDDITIGTGVPGALTQQLQIAYKTFVEQFKNTD